MKINKEQTFNLEVARTNYYLSYNTMGQTHDKLERFKMINVISCLWDYQQHNITINTL